MSLHVIRVPDIGEGVAEVELVEWLVAPGDEVAEDQPLVVVMTDKANVDIPSPVAGTVSRIGGEIGQMLAVGAELAAIETDEAGDATARGAAAGAASSQVTGGPVGLPLRSAGRTGEGKALASPSVRRHARELGVDLTQVTGTGPDGRVRHEDLDHFARLSAQPGSNVGQRARSESESESESENVAPSPGALGSDSGRTDVPGRDEVRAVAMIGLRRRIAEATQEAWRRIPHFGYVEEVDVTEVEALRATLNARHAEARGRLTLLPFLLRAIVLAVRENPRVNARFDDEASVVTLHGAVHAGIATHTEAGLLVPVLRHAEARDLWSMAAEIARLAQSARAATARREELSGSTITVTSLGALGGVASAPVINRPEVAIVGVNRIVERPTVRGGNIAVRKMMNLSSSFDHRVVDGMDAARFVQSVRGFLECPATLFVD